MRPLRSRAARVVLAVGSSAGCLISCGGSSEKTTFDQTRFDIVELPGFPHSTDIYSVQGAKRALVILHGHGGRNFGVGKSLGLHDSERPPTGDQIDWEWLEERGVSVALPQGQALPQGSTETWSSRAMDSGVDDVKFLKALASYLETELEIPHVYLLGHSGGGMMVNRMWCESPSTFAGYVSISGPASAYYADPATPCAPKTPMPYLGIFGEEDALLGIPGNWDAELWTLSTFVSSQDEQAWLNPVFVGAWADHVARSRSSCVEAPSLDDAESNDGVERWTNCGGTLELQRVLEGQHKIESLESAAGYRLLDEAMRFIANLDAAGD